MSYYSCRPFHFGGGMKHFQSVTALRACAGAVPFSTLSSRKQPKGDGVRDQLLQTLNLEIKELEALDVSMYGDLVTKLNAQVVQDNKTREISISFKNHGYLIRARIAESEIEEEEQELPQDDSEDKSEQFTYPTQKFFVDVRTENKDSLVFRLHALAEKDGKLYFERVVVGKSVEELDTKNDLAILNRPGINFDDLSEDLQDRLADFMDHLKVDDDLARLVQLTSGEFRRRNHLNNLLQLNTFVHPN